MRNLLIVVLLLTACVFMSKRGQAVNERDISFKQVSKNAPRLKYQRRITGRSVNGGVRKKRETEEVPPVFAGGLWGKKR